MNGDGDILLVKEWYHRFYVCDACGTTCYFCVTNDHNSLPPPVGCAYNVPGMDGYDDSAPAPNWREMENIKRS